MQVNLQNEETKKKKKSLGLCSESTFVFISLPYSRYMALVNTRRCVKCSPNVSFLLRSSEKKQKTCVVLSFCHFSVVFSVPRCFCWSVSSFLVEGTRFIFTYKERGYICLLNKTRYTVIMYGILFCRIFKRPSERGLGRGLRLTEWLSRSSAKQTRERRRHNAAALFLRLHHPLGNAKTKQSSRCNIYT